VTGPRTTSRLTGFDALPVLICYVVVLMGIPSQLILRPLGAAGTPAQIIGVGLLAWWLFSRLGGTNTSRISNPVKTILLLFVLAILVSYIAGMIRPIAFIEEVNSSDRAILSLLSWCGVTLVIIDGIASRENLDKLLKIVAGGATFIAVLGLLQFFFKIDLAHYVHLPGLSANGNFGELLARSSFQRVSGTTSHPIEFGAVLSSALPLVIHYARFAETARARRYWWIATALVGIVLPMSVARSAILGAAVAVIYLFYTWPPKLKLRMLFAGALGVAAMTFLVPGLLGTIKGLFLDASNDPSTAGRTADYAPVIHYIGERPLFGRGIGTFVPSLYRTLDNQYLGIAVEAGLVGLAMTLSLFVATNCVAGSVRRNTTDESTRDLAQCLKAGITVLAVNSAFFDTFGFPMAAGMVFLLIGATGALWATETKRGPRPYDASQRRRAVGLAAATLFAVASLGWWSISTAQPQYQAFGSVVLVPPSVNQSAFATSGRADIAASVLHDILVSDEWRETLGNKGVHDYEVALGNASLMTASDVVGTGGPTLRFVTKARDAQTANTALATLLRETGVRLTAIQANASVPVSERIGIEVLQQSAAFAVGGRPARAEGMFLIVMLTLLVVLRYRIRQRSSAIDAADAGVPRSGLVSAQRGAGR
jgi:O-antigen ligase